MCRVPTALSKTEQRAALPVFWPLRSQPELEPFERLFWERMHACVFLCVTHRREVTEHVVGSDVQFMLQDEEEKWVQRVSLTSFLLLSIQQARPLTGHLKASHRATFASYLTQTALQYSAVWLSGYDIWYKKKTTTIFCFCSEPHWPTFVQKGPLFLLHVQQSPAAKGRNVGESSRAANEQMRGRESARERDTCSLSPCIYCFLHWVSKSRSVCQRCEWVSE